MDDVTFETGKQVDLFAPNDNIRYGMVRRDGNEYYRFVCRGIEDNERANALMRLAGVYLDTCEQTKRELPFRAVKVERMLEDSKFYVGEGKNYHAYAYAKFISCIDRFNRYSRIDTNDINFMVKYSEVYFPEKKEELNKIKALRERINLKQQSPTWSYRTNTDNDSWLDWLNPFSGF